MNCRVCQKIVFRGVAAGDMPLRTDVSDHQQWCAICQKYYELQISLIRSINSGVQTIVNREVPSSLLPGLRYGLSQQDSTDTARNYFWKFALVAALAILTMSISFVRREKVFPNSMDRAPVASSSVANRASHMQPTPKSSSDLRPRTGKRAVFPAHNQVSSAPSTEVIVLAEERHAFAQFVAELPKKPEVALALTRPARVVPDIPIEFALLRIEEMELQPLETTQGE